MASSGARQLQLHTECVKPCWLSATAWLHPVWFARRCNASVQRKNIYVLSGSGTSIDVKMLMTCYWSHMKNKSPENLGGATEDEVWKYIQWDLETLLSGIHPVLDATGQPWPMHTAESKVQGQPWAGVFFVPWIVKRNLAYSASVLGLEHWHKAVHPCMFCKADRANWPWTDQRLLGHPNCQRTEAPCRPQRAQAMIHNGFGLPSCARSVTGSGTAHCRQHLP